MAAQPWLAPAAFEKTIKFFGTRSAKAINKHGGNVCLVVTSQPLFKEETAMDSLVPLLVLGTSLWVIYDAKTIGLKKGHLTGLESFWWFVGCLLLWAAAFSVYFAAWKGQLKGLGALGPWGWFLGCLALWVFPMYLAKRGEFKRTRRVPATAEDTLHHGPGPYLEGAAQRCPFCMEEIKDGALKCKHCGSMLENVVDKFPDKSIHA